MVEATDYAGVFVDGRPGRVQELMEEELGLSGLTDPGGVRIGGVEVEVRNNEIARELARAGDVRPADDFLAWSTLVEIEAPEALIDQMKDLTRRILEKLWEAGLNAVAACDYEEELPHGGGIELLRK